MKRRRKTEAQLVEELRAKTDRKAGLKRTAEELEFSPQFIWDVLDGRRSVTPRLAERMGYLRVVEYESTAR